LGLEQCDVGLPNQRLGEVARAVRTGRAYRQVEEDRNAVDDDGLVGKLVGAAHVSLESPAAARQQQRQFVRVEVEDALGAGLDVQKPIGQRTQGTVGGAVAEHIGDLFEVIDVHQRQRDVLRATSGEHLQGAHQCQAVG